ncbi:acylneuraminate cytidylyltransferase [Ignavibacteria bacterium CHB1]|nr:MAG: acylneuraminate cytidylyltransferase [Chlorobiota bacterium]MCC6886541.1 glycosyltransferase family protein [Ignavibacteriales bacterium]MCE7952383.1 acylneuraminate cytidylyltransferase [Chlorobi bacterium CHB7]MDL1886500.1 acylneuraminate cytidylyltransferase [Ignavibacteria bacterium CHB1]RIK48951.1 MAG: acylneuraminate cytidylyltransferase [Ignavibacteriota bacterium]
MKRNILAIIQARTGSSRLPDKVFLPLAGMPLLIRMYQRVASAKTCDSIVIATTNRISDDKIEELCNEFNIPCFRGDENDLLDRHYKAAVKYSATHIVKIPSDCPLIDPGIIDRVINFYLNNIDDFDFVSNLHPPSYPDGNDVEIMPLKILETAWVEAAESFEREHTTPFIWERPDRFRIGNVVWETGLDYSMSHRFTIDYLEDYLFIKAVYDELFDVNPEFTLSDILSILEKNPNLMKINRKYAGVNWYRENLDKLKTISPSQTKLL